MICSDLPADSVKVTPRHWRKAVSVGGGFMRLSGEKICANDVPFGFYQWDLLKVNTATQRNVVTFCERWGAPIHPLRFSPDCFIPETYETVLKAIEATDAMNEIKAAEGLKTPFVYWRESAIAIRDFQAGIRAILLSVLGEAANEDDLVFISEAMSHCFRAPSELSTAEHTTFESHIDAIRAFNDDRDVCLDSNYSADWRGPNGFSIQATYGITNAICNQVYQEIDPASGCWHVCSKCGIPFKRARVKDSKRQTERTNSKRRTCADNCTGKNDRLHTK
ncbi:hypothetical protein [Slackia sp.]|uniref:hypothetical protein n=1 Tax=Slackia sp. TaxID=2049041 RepID=UPI0025799824|nr:hypothetical protein [Slackia sp.]MBS6498886.1 hypothetical protein [Slackia sp.]